jgi:purine-binding chemotaxis protein CheW
MAIEQQYCTFLLGDLFLGIEVLKVQEVLRGQALTRVPLAPRSVHGLINLRGQIVTAIDLRERLDLPPRAPDVPPMNVVVRTEDGAVSLLVDEIGDVLEVSDVQYEDPPDTLPAAARELIGGVFKLPERLLMILNIDRALSLDAVPAAR